jgi:hypothetical protein
MYSQDYFLFQPQQQTSDNISCNETDSDEYEYIKKIKDKSDIKDKSTVDIPTDTTDDLKSLVNANRMLYYEINKERIHMLRLKSRHKCPCGSDVISAKRAQHLLSKRHRLFVLENPTVSIPMKPTSN